MVLAGRLARPKPPLQGRLALARSPPSQQIFYTDVFVEVWPMDAMTAADQLPVLALRGSPVGKPRVPRQWNRQRSTVREFNDERIVRNPNLLSQCKLQINR
jgi:hypothetical protein